MMPDTIPRRTACFRRQYLGYTGGHGKVWDYFNHVSTSGLYEAQIYFTRDSIFDHSNPWARMPEKIVPAWEPEKADLLFLAGMDWQAVPAGFPPGIPIINLIQHVRHADPNVQLYKYLENRAIRMCVSQPVADAILHTGRVNGPVIVIPNGIEIPEEVKTGDHSSQIFIGALKNPNVGIQVADQLVLLGYEADLLTGPMLRTEYLARLGKARIAIFLPNPTEGFYLPGVEAMALGTPVIMPDCIGNREYARHGENCLLVALENIIPAVRQFDSPSEIARFQLAGIETARRYTLASEYESFYNVLKDVESLFGMDCV